MFLLPVQKAGGIQVCMRLAAIVLAVVFLLVELRIITGMCSRKEKDLPYIIVLGAHVEGTVVSDSLKRRLDKAEEYLRKNADTVVIVSGGQGKGELITEAQAMENYLINGGIHPSRIRKEEVSKTTKENLEYSAVFLTDKAVPVGIITNNFHVYRACLYAKRAGYTQVKGIPAGCHPVLFVNYMTREFFAVVKFLLTGKSA